MGKEGGHACEVLSPYASGDQDVPNLKGDESSRRDKLPHGLLVNGWRLLPSVERSRRSRIESSWIDSGPLRLGNKNAKTRQQAADLVTKLAGVIRHCGEDALLSKLGVGLFEQLREEFPEALACKISVISGCIAKAIGPQNVLQVQLAGAGTPKSCVLYRHDCHCCRNMFAFTTIPHTLQEHRTPELNVRNSC
ncbi:hypothetical protein A4X13_0g1357 [Tilletia indica]|uniref:Uncharacterized protein n=1 Tax=Tilletia indica TaxID=43049 RepID=A0A8T8TE10_9BASI|nr:hypothetical protein A4X13_0g1357 [Tilletia indica]